MKLMINGVPNNIGLRDSMRSFFPKHLRDLFKKKEEDKQEGTRGFSFDTGNLSDEELTLVELDGRHPQQLDKERDDLQHWYSLSPREKEVVALVCMDHRNYQIAEVLGIANGTVKSHLENIFKKFNLRDRHAIRLALRDWDFQTWWEIRRQLPTPLPPRTIYR